MKSLIQAIAIAVTLAIPAMSYAQSNQPVTRAKARSELVQLEKAGYDPAIGHKQYPKNIQAAEAKVASERIRRARMVAQLRILRRPGMRCARAPRAPTLPAFLRPQTFSGHKAFAVLHAITIKGAQRRLTSVSIVSTQDLAPRSDR
jgi:hypothetical protein